MSQLSLKAYAFNARRAKNRLPSGVCWTNLQSGATPLLRTEARRLMFLDTSLYGGTLSSVVEQLLSEKDARSYDERESGW